MFARKQKASECLTIHRTGLEKIAFLTASVSTRDRSDQVPSSIAVAELTVHLPPAKFGADGYRSSASIQRLLKMARTVQLTNGDTQTTAKPLIGR
ncbi:hypothetical protein [Pseudomonas viridiflava]|uniref:hypothetical protein n=1 Tax=Pseudomonas viridiflava TaxID=33069 RepID=UPI001C318F4A|nr:hypothetical protein [Pseudomonas viridiflava]QXG42091.1 hypothetical protein KTT55_06205 [Pseudomonas viridiflava]